MRTECKYYYIANDGKEFDNEEECFNYENNLLYGSVIKNKELKMFNYNKEETSNVCECFYLKCDSVSACEMFIELCNREGAYTPFKEGDYGYGDYDVEKGTWYYNGKIDRWISLQDIKNLTNEIEELFK